MGIYRMRVRVCVVVWELWFVWALCGLWVVGCGLWVVGCGLWVVGRGLSVVGCGLWCVVWCVASPLPSPRGSPCAVRRRRDPLRYG